MYADSKHKPEIKNGPLLICPTRGIDVGASKAWFCFYRVTEGGLQGVASGYGEVAQQAEENAKAKARARLRKYQQISLCAG